MAIRAPDGANNDQKCAILLGDGFPNCASSECGAIIFEAIEILMGM